MKLTKALLGDSLGVRLEVPAKWRLVGESDEAAQLLQDDQQLQWWLFWFPGMELALGKGGEGEDAEIEAGMRHYAKAMFETMFRNRPSEEDAGAGGEESGEGEEGEGSGEDDDAGDDGGDDDDDGDDDGDDDAPVVAAKESAGTNKGVSKGASKSKSVEVSMSAGAGDKGAAVGSPGEPRTADPEWTPMVDCERVQVGGAAALRTVHRMVYQPDDEIVMGHLMVPVKGGMFEVRMVARDATTGVRESLLLAMQSGPEKGKALKQKDYDDPKHDEKFEMHSLSRVRRALRWLIEDAGLKVLAPAAAHEGGEVVLAKLDCALVPPPRFVRSEALDDYNLAVFERVGFCGTDGLERLLVQRVDELKKLVAEQLRGEAEVFTRELNELNGVREVKLKVEDLTIGERRCVMVVVEGEGKDGRVRNSFCWLLDGKGRPYFVGILGSDAVPAEARREELRAAVAGWRSTRDGKPWWKLW